MGYFARGTETATRSGDALLTRIQRKPPTWLVECSNDKGEPYKVILIKNDKKRTKKQRWGVMIPDGVGRLFGSRRLAVRYAISLNPQRKEAEPEGAEL